MKDKRDECGCHKDCFIPHGCDNPCTWPDCLTEEESVQLVQEILEDLMSTWGEDEG